MPRRIAVGRLTGVFGIRGELACVPSDLGSAALVAGRSFALGEAPDAPQVTCRGVRRHHRKLLLSFEGITTPEAARAFAGRTLFADDVEVELGPDEYLDADLVGLHLVDEHGNDLGEVVGVRHFPAQDCLVVGPRDALVPLVKAFVGAIDLRARTIRTTLPEGLLDG